MPRTQRANVPERSWGQLGLAAVHFTGLLSDADKAGRLRSRTARTVLQHLYY